MNTNHPESCILTPEAIYIHIPFCVQKCLYCDFNSYSGLESLFELYTTALNKEIQTTAPQYPTTKISTIYLGGGTPNILPSPLIQSILNQLATSFKTTQSPEITMEANPGLPIDIRHQTSDFRHPASSIQHPASPNRISLGLQSLHNPELNALGRIHTAEQAIEAYHEARTNGFTNISLDLMYGIPRQTPQSWHTTLEEVIALNPEHISLYSLTIEEGTPFWDMQHSGSLQLPGDEQEADMYEHAIQTLTQSGYEHYEISNFARPGCQCRHNITYWKNNPYFGFGAGASGYLNGRRYTNIQNVQEYIKRATSEEPTKRTDRPQPTSPSPKSEVRSLKSLIETEERLDKRGTMGETMFLGLRMIHGVNKAAFKTRYNITPNEAFPTQIAALKAQALLEETDTHLRLTHHGLLFANDVFAEFVE